MRCRQRAIGALGAVLAMLWAGQGAAQSDTTDQRLKELIPDAAVADPRIWAQTNSPAPGSSASGQAPATAASQLKPDSPMTDLPGETLAWPDIRVALPPLVSLEPEADLAGLLPPAAGVPLPGTAQLAGAPLSTGKRSSAPALRDAFSGGRVTLDYPVGTAGFPERAALEKRFRALSAVATLPARESGNVGQLAVRAATDRDLLLRLLRTYGYYDGEVIQSVGSSITGSNAAATGGSGNTSGAGQVRVNFEIVPGARYSFGAIELGQLAQTGVDYPRLRSSLGIATGDPLHADAIVSGKISLDTALGQSGYPFAKIGDAALVVDHRRETGDLALPVTPGGKYRFAGIVSTMPRFMSARHLARIARFKPGQVWQRSKVEDLRQAILATGLVASVTVTPKATTPPVSTGTTPDQPGEVMLDVAMAKAKQRTVSAAIGYDTAEGFRLETTWENRNLFPPEGLLRLRAIAGTQEQLAGVTFRRNNLDGRDRVLTFDLYAQNADLTAYAARKLAFLATYERLTTLLFQKPWVWSVGVETVASAEREGEPNGTVLGNSDVSVINYAIPRTNYLTAAMPLRIAYDGSDSLLDPRRGWRVALRVSPELAMARGKTSPYVVSQFDLSGYRPVAAGAVLAGRVRLGAIAGTDLASIAPSRRFYAGGGASIRGFGYELVGPINANAQLTGGRSLYEVSVEARLHTGLFGGALSLVPFFDAGGVGTGQTPDFHDIRYGAGLGVRYNTGFGPLRIDVGAPLNRRPGENRVGVYIALGQAF